MIKDRVIQGETIFGELFPENTKWHELFTEAWEDYGMPPWSYEDRKSVSIRTGTWQAKIVGFWGQRAITWRGVVHLSTRWERIYDHTRWPEKEIKPESYDRQAFVTVSHELTHAWKQKTQGLESLPRFILLYGKKYAGHLLRCRFGRKHPIEKDAYGVQEFLNVSMNKIPYDENYS